MPTRFNVSSTARSALAAGKASTGPKKAETKLSSLSTISTCLRRRSTAPSPPLNFSASGWTTAVGMISKPRSSTALRNKLRGSHASPHRRAKRGHHALHPALQPALRLAFRLGLADKDLREHSGMVLRQPASNASKEHHQSEGQYHWFNDRTLQQGSNIERTASDPCQVPLHLQLARSLQSLPGYCQDHQPLFCK